MASSHSCQPSRCDILGAFICAGAVYCDGLGRTSEYIRRRSEKCSLKFGEVHVSHDNVTSNDESKFLVAYTPIATFIAFRGCPDSDDNIDSWISMQKRCPSPHRSLAEATLGLYGNVFGGSEFIDIVSELINSRKRVIFCGYRIGGVVAHLVVLRFLQHCSLAIPEVSVANFSNILRENERNRFYKT